MEEGACEVKKLVTFENLLNEQLHQLDRLRHIMSRLRAIRESVSGSVPEEAECGGVGTQERSCFLERAIQVNSDICTEFINIEQEIAHLESICNCVPKSINNMNAKRARFNQELR